MKVIPFWMLMAGLAGCAVGPDYRRPETPTPPAYRGNETLQNPTHRPAEMRWSDLVSDPVLLRLMSSGLTNSFDLQIASARVLQARASLGLARSEFFPSIAAGGNWSTARASQRGPSAPGPGIDPQYDVSGVAVGMASYEVDLWGRIRRSNEAARARLLASESNRELVLQTLLSEIGRAYYQLIELDAEREIARRSYGNRTNSLRLTTVREAGGVASLQDVRQAEVLVHTSTSTQTDIERRRDQKENELRLLLGLSPGAVDRGPLLSDQIGATQIAVGLPSDLLLRRPDIQVAEQQLIAANADIGQARAAYFPQITLTGSYGYQSLALSDLFSGPARTWQFGPSVSVPLFTGGRIRANNRLAKARYDEALANYQKAVQTGFREVSDALIGYQKSREFQLEQLSLTESRRDAARLAAIRYEGGVTSYLEVLYNEQELLNAELVLAQAQRDILLSVIQLFRAVGGGPL